MTRTVKRFAFSGAAACCFLGLAMSAIGQIAGDIRIYGGESLSENGIVLKPWGSGEVKESEEQVLSGNKSLKVTTQGLYQGAHLVFQKPFDLGPAVTSPKTYLRVSLKVSDTKSSNYGMPGMGGMPGMPGMSGMGKTAGGKTGGMGGMMPGGLSTSSASLTKPKAIERVRVVLGTSDGKKTEVLFQLSDMPRGQDDWRTLAIPLAKIPGLEKTNGQLASVIISADSTGVLFVGQIGTIHDDTPITIADFNDRTVAVNDNVTFTADAEGGNSPLEYHWTVVPKGQEPADLSDLPIDMEGRSVKYEFRKSGDYVVYVTVRDLYGLKKPGVRSTNIHVSL